MKKRYITIGKTERERERESMIKEKRKKREREFSIQLAFEQQSAKVLELSVNHLFTNCIDACLFLRTFCLNLVTSLHSFSLLN